MKKLLVFLCSILLGFAVAGTTSATLINFDDATEGEVLNSKYSAFGISFIGMSGGDVTAHSSYDSVSPVSNPNMAVSDDTGIRIDFSVPVFGLSLYGCDYGGNFPDDNEIATLTAYDSLDNLIGTTTVTSTRGTKGGWPTDIAFLDLASVADIAYAKFTFTQTLSFFGIDDVEFNAEAVPEPATILLLGSGLLGVVGFRKRFRRK